MITAMAVVVVGLQLALVVHLRLDICLMTSYSIPFYDILISIGLTTANVKRMFQEDIRSANDFATYIDQEVPDWMLEKDDYGLNTLSMVKQ